jgi:hypothetical protein
MKSSSCGTLSEQSRARMGWYKASDRPMCQNCAHVDANYPDRAPSFDKPKFHCRSGNFSTAAGACCAKFRSKE